MAGQFESLLAAADAAVDTVFAEAFAFTPMREVKNGKPVPSSTRSPIAEVTAVFDAPAYVQSVGSPTGPNRVNATPQLTIVASELPEGVLRFDRFTRAADSRVYEVTEVKPDGLGRYILALVEVS